MRARKVSPCSISRAAVVVTFALSSSAASAQAPHGQQTLESVLMPGMTVWITDSGGREEKTRIVGVRADTVTTASGDRTRHLRSTDVRRVRVRRSDNVVNGALIGAGGAVASGLFLCGLTESWEICRHNVGPMLRIGALGAALGVGVDALIRGRTTIYDATGRSARLQAEPIVTADTVGLRMSIGF